MIMITISNIIVQSNGNDVDNDNDIGLLLSAVRLLKYSIINKQIGFADSVDTINRLACTSAGRGSMLYFC